MKGKNKNNNDKKARKPETGEASAYSEVLDSSENKPTDDFMDTPAESSKKSVTLNDLAEIAGRAARRSRSQAPFAACKQRRQA